MHILTVNTTNTSWALNCIFYFQREDSITYLSCVHLWSFHQTILSGNSWYILCCSVSFISLGASWSVIISLLETDNSYTLVTPRRVDSRYEYDWTKSKVNLHNIKGQRLCLRLHVKTLPVIEVTHICNLFKY